ncbi:MAG: response regulator [bacterium]
MSQNIMIVDDSPTLRTSVLYTLSEQGYNVLEAENGVDALKKLIEFQEKGIVISLILSDINMPEMDGITFIQEVKKSNLKFIPVIVLTTEDRDDLKNKGREAGAAAWLVKPFKEEQLLWVVKKFTR